MEQLKHTRDILANLIAFPTISADSNLDMLAYVADLLEASGAHVDFVTSPCGRKANLLATIGPEVDGGILLSGHSDVVPVADQAWTVDPFQMTEHEGRLFGRGSCDMKGFIAATLAMAPVLAPRVGTRPLHFAFTYDEEVGCLGAQQLVGILRERGPRPDIAIIGEPTEMRIIEGHKGCCEYSTHFTGTAGHGSNPEKGVNAVEYAVRYADKLLSLRDLLATRSPAESRFDPPWTTLNIGALNGGVARNVIATRAQLDWEMRPVQPADASFVKGELARFCDQELLPKMRAVHPDADIALEVIGEVAGLEPTEENEARRIVASLTGQDTAELVAFGTEAGIFQELGTDVVVCGPGSIEQAHQPDEFVSLEQLSQCLAMLERLGDRLQP